MHLLSFVGPAFLIGLRVGIFVGVPWSNMPEPSSVASIPDGHMQIAVASMSRHGGKGLVQQVLNEASLVPLTRIYHGIMFETCLWLLFHGLDNQSSDTCLGSRHICGNADAC